MQLQRSALTSKKVWQVVLCLGLVALAVWARALLWQALLQLFFGLLVALLAMPIMRRLETRFSAGISASLSMLAVSALFLGSLLLLIPLAVGQIRQLMALLPSLYATVNEWMQRGENWLIQNGIPMNTDMKASLLHQGEALLTDLLPATITKAGGMVQGLGKVMLAPAFAFYFLRDRKWLSGILLLWFPAGWRDTVVKILREMRRETASFLRGQLTVSAVVGILTGLGLLLVGMPAWLLLGMIMGILELIPYVGPFVGGFFVLLFALQGGMPRALWALGVVILVQQLEGGVLSPQLMSDATRLHPVAVLLCVMLGGAAGGVMGILLSVPLLLCARAALRVVSLRAMEREYRGSGFLGDRSQKERPKS